MTCCMATDNQTLCDVLTEVAKNINQAKALSMQHYVDEYHSHVEQNEQMTSEKDSAVADKHVHTVRSSVKQCK